MQYYCVVLLRKLEREINLNQISADFWQQKWAMMAEMIGCYSESSLISTWHQLLL